MLSLETLKLAQGDFRLSADLTVQKGAKTAVMGPSGAGKSTLLAALAGFLPLGSGRLIWDGQDISAALPGARPIAMLFQDGNLFPHLNVAQNVGLGLRPALKLTQRETQQVEAALDRVGLGTLGQRRPAELSGGQQSRAALARVLVQARPLILLDEPFAALGPALKSEMLDLVAGLADETHATLLMVSHDPGDARRITDSVIVVADGVATAPRPTAQVLDDPTGALRAYLGAPER
ncbi:MAG: ATP-binding cassette domain-containing protein [Sedimentitalea sp.]